MAEIYTSIEEVLPVLRAKLTDYLKDKLHVENVKKPFKCLWHEDEGRPNMILNPKSSYQTAHCFACGKTADIFVFAETIDQLPSNGHEWITVTLPSLCRTLKIQYNFGEPTQAQKEKTKLYKFCSDIADILEAQEFKGSYGQKRGWSNDKVIMASIDEQVLMDKLADSGWPVEYIIQSGIIKTKEKSFFGNDKFTFVIEDPYRRPIGFISRCFAENAEEKYIHTFDTSIFKKTKSIFGLGTDLNKCKHDGIYIVEGSGDATAAITKGIYNTGAVLGTALTEEHLLELKRLGIRKVVLCFDWDEGGIKATRRIVEQIIPKVQDMNYLVKLDPKDGSKDLDDYFKKHTAEEFLDLPEATIFEWQLHDMKDIPTEQVCEKMISIIAVESSAVRRALMIQQLSKFTKVPEEAIDNDVSTLRNHDLSEKKQSMVAVAQQFQAALEQDPDNYMSLMSTLEEDIQKVEKKYAKAVVGVNYQLQRYEDIQKLRSMSNEGKDFTTFKFTYFKDLGDSLSGGMPYTRGCLIYAGGRANSGKTLSCIALGCDVALYDEDAMTIIHSIDDSYEQIEPRIKTNLYNMYYQEDMLLTLDMAVSPYKYNYSKDIIAATKKGEELFKQLLLEERLVILDGNDGMNLTSLEKQWRYYRSRHPNRKLFGICDNTHDYEDYAHLERTGRMTLISSAQKRLATKYNACLLATAEYRKADRSYSEKIVFPTNDDLADARALAYRPNIIFHVYNDIADRGEKAEIFWYNKDTGTKEPRLLWLFTKNKINSFKGKLVRDVDKLTVGCWPINMNEAKKEWENVGELPAKVQKQITEFDDELGYTVETEYVKE